MAHEIEFIDGQADPFLVYTRHMISRTPSGDWETEKAQDWGRFDSRNR